jgi:hypothetical protein
MGNEFMLTAANSATSAAPIISPFLGCIWNRKIGRENRRRRSRI